MNKISLSPQTLTVLKNYSTINGSIVIPKGNQLKTISVGENAIAKYICEETFPQAFAIYDLNQFLSGLSLFDNPVLEFNDPNYVLIHGRGRSTKYYFSDPEITLKSAPDRDVNFPETDIEFVLTPEDISALLKAHNVYGIDDLKISSQDGQIVLTLCDKEDETSNTYSQVLAGETTGDYEMFMKVENIRLVPGEYTVKISSKLITEWKHTNLDLTYYIALEP
jgi:hypothetical protein